MKTSKRILLGRKNLEKKKILLEGKRDSSVPRTGFFVALPGGHSWN
ncbi:MAG TPA: hypothetical protein VLJ18_04850 [Thermoanaerobaculia bacterium]|nr:hypothetical protein [Thermoanaerobaculia bacterium]